MLIPLKYKKNGIHTNKKKISIKDVYGGFYSIFSFATKF